MAEPIPPVKGTRDFYPDEYAPTRAILDAWRRVSIVHGFREFEGPTLEHTDLYTRKSGDEIVEQLFTLTDRGGRNLALRPEMTPTLARMVAARQGSLPRPIKWFCMPRLYRGERPQRGRLREFLQWNIDILGVSGVIADAECILVAVDGLRELGLTADDIVVRINDRRLMAAVLSTLGIPTDSLPIAYALLDKLGKLPNEELSRRWSEALGGFVAFDRLWEVMSADSIDELKSRIARHHSLDGVAPAAASLETLIAILRDYGIFEFCKIDFRIVRGLAYYTGPVFEIYDRPGKLRAICGGGRYDNLLEQMGGKSMPAVGFGMGDVVLLELLSDLKREPSASDPAAVFVVDATTAGERWPAPMVTRLVARLRRGGLVAEFAYESQAVGKQFKRAADRGCRMVVIVGQETIERNVLQIKDLTTGQQREAALDDVLSSPAAMLRPTDSVP